MAATVAKPAYAAGVPAPLWEAIVQASGQYHVPADLLVGIWRVESGSHYPNPYVNSSGYGGLFGTHNWSGSTQSQANEAASILANLLQRSGGNVSQALSSYSGGGYTSVPGERTFGNVQNGIHNARSSLLGTIEHGAMTGVQQLPGATLVPSAIGAAGGIGAAAGDVLHPFKSFEAFFDFITSWRFVELVGGSLLVLLGLYLVARQFGANAALPTPVQAAGGAVARAAEQPVRQAQRRRRTGKLVRKAETTQEARSRARRAEAEASYGSDIPY